MARLQGSFNKESHSPAILRAVAELATHDRGPTRRELATHLSLSEREIANAVDNLTRTKHLFMARLRRVAYRTRPVAEYVTEPPEHPTECSGRPGDAIAAALASWRNV
jgi:hypothetical protein